LLQSSAAQNVLLLPKAMNWLSDAEFTRLSHFASIVAMRIDNVVIVDQTGARSRPREQDERAR
jgi:hypothetical protein